MKTFFFSFFLPQTYIGLLLFTGIISKTPAYRLKDSFNFFSLNLISWFNSYDIRWPYLSISIDDDDVDGLLIWSTDNDKIDQHYYHGDNNDDDDDGYF